MKFLRLLQVITLFLKHFKQGIDLEFDRYKIVVQVDIGEFKGQGIKIASRALWDTNTDTYASSSFKNVL